MGDTYGARLPKSSLGTQLIGRERPDQPLSSRIRFIFVHIGIQKSYSCCSNLNHVFINPCVDCDVPKSDRMHRAKPQAKAMPPLA